MNRKLSFAFPILVVFLFVVLLPPFGSAQKQNNSKTTAADKDKKAEETRAEAERRAVATSLLLDIAEESSKFRDLMLRARVQARAADTLWDADQDRARDLFKKSWSAADIADKETMRRFNEEVKAAMKERGSWAGNMPTRVREEVLKLVARRDKSLAEDLLKKLDEAQKEESENAAKELKEEDQSPFENPNDPYELTPAQRQRISVARSLLETDVERAVQFADPALFRVSMDTIGFLSALREKNAALADQRYLSMLARAASDPSSDANAVSFLSSYIFTPFQFVRYGREGSISSNVTGSSNKPFDNDEARSAFIRFAEQVLLRPVQQREQPGATTGNWGTFKTIERLMPDFERYASPETVTAMRAQMGLLKPGQQPQQQTDDDDIFLPKTSPQDEGKDFVQRAIERADRAKTQEERDQIYLTAAITATHKNDQRAYMLIDKVEDSEMRGRLRAFVDFMFVSKAIEDLRSQKKDEEKSKQKTAAKDQKRTDEKKKTITIDEVVNLIRKGEITHFQRAWGLIEVARIIGKSDKEKARDLLEEAANEAQRISNSDPDRPQAFVGITTAYLEINRQRGWEFVSETVRAANSCESYKGEDARLTTRIQTKGMSSVMTSSLENYDLPNLFKALAKQDLNRAISQARSFGGESPRSTAIITIAQTILQKKEEDKKQKAATPETRL
jgi:hypothetical protein